VIAQAFVFVFGSFLINFLEAFPPPYTVDRLLVGGFHANISQTSTYLSTTRPVNTRRCADSRSALVGRHRLTRQVDRQRFAGTDRRTDRQKKCARRRLPGVGFRGLAVDC
jgi:hypothetical protein